MTTWSVQPIDFGEEAPPAFCCDAAAAFAGWLTLLQDAVNNAKIEHRAIALRQAKLQLMDRWWAMRQAQPKNHRDRVANKNGDPCIYQLFLAGVSWLLTQELAVEPPPLAVPPKTVRQNLYPPIRGIYLGEQAGE
jgi:hypothetical protein